MKLVVALWVLGLVVSVAGEVTSFPYEAVYFWKIYQMSKKADKYDKIATGCTNCNTFDGFLKYIAKDPKQIKMENIAEDTNLSVDDLASKVRASGWDGTNDFTKLAPAAFKQRPDSVKDVVDVMTTYSEEIRKQAGDEKVGGLLGEAIKANGEVIAKRSTATWKIGGPNLQTILKNHGLDFEVKFTESGVIDTEATIASKTNPVADEKLSNFLKKLIAGKTPEPKKTNYTPQEKIWLGKTKSHLSMISTWQSSLDSLSKALPCKEPASTTRRRTILSASQKRKRLLRARHGASKWSSDALFGA